MTRKNVKDNGTGKGEVSMKKKGWTWMTAALVIAMAAASVSGCSTKKGTQPETAMEDEAGKEATGRETSEPTGKDEIFFETTDLDGETVTQDILSEKKLTMINVWATYCTPCISEMPDLGEIASAYAEKDVQIVGIVSDVQEGDDTEAAKKIVDDTGAAYRHLLLNQLVYMTFLNGVTAVPVTFFVDQEGNKVGETYVGAREKAEWIEIIDSLL